MSIMDWYFGNIQKAAQAREAGQLSAQSAHQQQMAEQYGPQAQAIMGTPAAGPPDMYGNQPQAATGLMADPNDPMRWAQMGMGLMGIPGFQDVGTQVFTGFMAHQLGEKQRLAEAQRAQQLHNMRMMELMASLDKMDREIDDKQLAQSSGWYKDYRADTKGLRTGLVAAESALGMIADKGIAGASNADMVGLITAIAKLRDPDSAVLTGEIDVLAAAKGLEGIGPALLNMIQLGSDIPFPVRKQLVDTLVREERSRLQELNNLRRAAAERASEYQIRGAKLLPELRGSNQDSMQKVLSEKEGSPPVPKGMTPEKAQMIRDKAREENPTWIDKAYNWYRN